MRRTIAALVLAISAPALADDWTQWRGPTRDGISAEKNLASSFPASGPKILWKAEVGKGYSTFTAADGKAFTQGDIKGKETVTAFDAATGKVLWQYAADNGPRGGDDKIGGAPAYDKGKLYVLAAPGSIHCLDAATGKVIWTKNAQKDFGGQKPQYSFVTSPLLFGDNLIVDVGTTICIKKDTGDLVWKTKTEKPGYGSPVPFKSGDKTLLATFKASGLVVNDSKDGAQIAVFKWNTSYDVNAATPIIEGNNIFISSGYGRGCALVALSGDKLTKTYENKEMQNQYTTSVLHEGHIYGMSDGSRLKCINLATGKTIWQETDIKAGGLILADGKLIIMADKGKVHIVEASPKGFNELAQASVLSGECWTAPSLSNGLLFVRNTNGNAACIDLRK
jgi:outer membrane protein assembly factor BamB